MPTLFTEEEKRLFNRDTNDMLQGKRAYHLQRIAFHQRQITSIEALLEVGKNWETVTIPSKVSEPIQKQVERKNRWAKPAFKIIVENNRLLKTEEIFELLKIKVHDNFERREHIISISQALSKMVKRGRIKSYTIKGVQGNYYGLHSMFDGEEPTSEYLQAIENKKEQLHLEATP